MILLEILQEGTEVAKGTDQAIGWFEKHYELLVALSVIGTVIAGVVRWLMNWVKSKDSEHKGYTNQTVKNSKEELIRELKAIQDKQGPIDESQNKILEDLKKYDDEFKSELKEIDGKVDDIKEKFSESKTDFTKQLGELSTRLAKLENGGRRK